MYDHATTIGADKGIFVTHLKSEYLNKDNMRTVTACGNFKWETPFWIPNPNGTGNLPAYRITGYNENGESHRNKITNTQGYQSWISVLADDQDNYEIGSFFRGYGFEDAFKTTNNNVFSPWSNPSTDTWANAQTSFAMEFLYQACDVINVRFLTSDVEDVPPAIPRNVAVSVQNNHPHVSWDPNSDPDILNYEVWKKGIGGFWFIAATTSNNYYTDTAADVVVFKSRDHIDLYYKIKAVDNTDKKSLFSETKSITVNKDIGPMFKLTDSWPEGLKPNEFALFSAYPNPFNPVTSIIFDLPEAVQVSLKVFDMRGSLIRELINEKREAGRYSVNFDGTKLASGVYIYELRAGAFKSIKKMMLIKYKQPD